MARPREFDANEVLDVALGVFWESGFQGTTLATIEEATGVKKASLFAAYGDKESLFTKAIERYTSDGRELFRDIVNKSSSPKEAIREWLACVGQMYVGAKSRRGCLAVNTIVEMASLEVGANEVLQRHMKQFSKQIAEQFAKGITNGEFRSDIAPAVAAKFLLSCVSGLSVTGKNGLSEAEMASSIELILEALE